MTTDLGRPRNPRIDTAVAPTTELTPRDWEEIWDLTREFYDMVMSVDAEGPGARAGVQQGDVIVTWDGQPVGHVAALLRSLGPVSVGTTITLGLRRGGDTRSVELVIGERPDD